MAGGSTGRSQELKLLCSWTGHQDRPGRPPFLAFEGEKVPGWMVSQDNLCCSISETGSSGGGLCKGKQAKPEQTGVQALDRSQLT